MAGIARGGSGPQRTTLPSQELLDDLCSRFVLNVPEEELQAFERILFSVEQAHWFYEDNTMEQNPSLKSLSLREFTSLMFQSCSALRPYITHIDDIYKDFTTYKTRVPVTGAIILDETLERCLLVKGWKAGASWSFPRGKKNKGEEDSNCAIREVMEETGFDIAPKLRLDDHLEVLIGQQRMRLYIIPGVRDDTRFAPLTKKEISEIAWHRVEELPMASNETQSHHRGPTGLKYFMVFPFVTPLKAWIARNRPQNVQRREVPLPGATVWKVRNMSSGGSGNLAQVVVETPPLLPMPVPVLPPAPSPSPPPPPQSQPEPETTIQPSTNAAVGQEPPGKAFRNFRFDFALILQQLDS